MNWDPTPEIDLHGNGNEAPPVDKGMEQDSQETGDSVRERRTGIDRRSFSYTHYVPERRRGRERRVASGMPDCSGH